MTKSASETTLKTSSLTGTDNTDFSWQPAAIAKAEAAALATPLPAHVLATERLLMLDQDTNGGMISAMLIVLERSHNAMRFTDFMTGDLGVWALNTLCNWKEEAAMPVVYIYLRTARVDADWTIPEQIPAAYLLPYYHNLVKNTVISQARMDLYDSWEAEEAQELAKKTFMDITGRPGLANAAGSHAHGAVLHEGMSAAEAVDATSKRLGLWTWATPEARAKRETARAIATRFVDGITPGMSEEARAAHVAGAVAEAIAAFPPPPLALKVPEFKEITDPGALAPSLEWLAAAPAPIYFPSPIDLGGAYGEGGQAEPVEGEPATPSLLGH